MYYINPLQILSENLFFPFGPNGAHQDVQVVTFCSSKNISGRWQHKAITDFPVRCAFTLPSQNILSRLLRTIFLELIKLAK